MTTAMQKTEQRAALLLTIAHHDLRKGLSSRALFKIGDHDTSEDLVQETFMKTWMYLLKGGKIETMKAFLYHILNNLIIDEYRRHRTESLDALLEKGFESFIDCTTDSLSRSLDSKAAFLLIARLPPRYQKVMHMRYIDGLSLSEMSLITGKTKNTLAVQVHRGLEKLKTLYRHI